MLEIRALQRIEAVAAHGSVTAAARALGMTQPALTRSIASAERGLGGALFRRSQGGAEPTALCRLLLAEAPEVLRRMQALHERLLHLRGGSGEEVAVTAGPFTAEALALPALLAARAAAPRLRVRLEVAPWPEAVARLRARLTDLAVVTEAAAEAAGGLLAETLPPQRLAFVVRRGHALAGGAPNLAAVLRHPLATTAQLSPRLHGHLAEARGPARAAAPFPALLAESQAAWIAAVRGGGMVALPPLADALAAGELVLLGIEAPWLQARPVILRSRAAEAAPVTAVLAAIRQAAAEAAGQAEALWRGRQIPSNSSVDR